MALAPAPTAVTISVRQALELLDGDFSALARGVAERRYAFWLGSGISRDRVDDLKSVIARILSFLRDRVDHANPHCPYRRALDEAVGHARLSAADRAQADYTRPISEWPIRDTLLVNLTQEYARVLDIRVAGQPDPDYLLWEAVDVRATFAPTTAVPDCEHICIAILVLEGVLPDVATANWDGLIEAAVDELTNDSATALRIPTMATPRSDAWRPPIPIDGDQGGVRAPLGEVGHLSIVT